MPIQREIKKLFPVAAPPRLHAPAPARSAPVLARALALALDPILLAREAGIEPDWVETAGPLGITPLVGVPSGPRLVAAVEQAFLAGRPDERAYVE